MKYQADLVILRTHVFISFDTAVATPVKQNTQYEVPGRSCYPQNTCLYQLWHSSCNSIKIKHTVWSTRPILLSSEHVFINFDTVVTTPVIQNTQYEVPGWSCYPQNTCLYQLWYSSHNYCNTKHTVWSTSTRLLVILRTHVFINFDTVVTTPVIQNTQYEVHVPGWACYPQDTCLYQLWQSSHNSYNTKHSVWGTRLLVILSTHVFINFDTVVTTPVIQNTQYEVPGLSWYSQNTCLYQLWHSSHNSCITKHTVWSIRLILIFSEHVSLSTLTQ